MPTKFFRKELIRNPVMVAGKRVQFESIGQERGLLILDDEKPEEKVIADALQEFSRLQKYGVVAITQQDYDNEKKNPLNSHPSGPRKPEKLRVMQPQRSPSPSAKSPVAEAADKALETANAALTETRAIEQRLKDFQRGATEARNGQQQSQGQSLAYNEGYASASGTHKPAAPTAQTPVAPVVDGKADPTPTPEAPFVPRVAPKQEVAAETVKPIATPTVATAQVAKAK